MNRRRQALRFFSYLIAVPCLNARAQAAMDSWYSPAATAADPSDTTLALHADFEEADRSQLKAVEEALATLPMVEISALMASRLAAREVAEPAGKRLFLVRSVRFAARGAYTVTSGSQSIRVHHHSLGFDAPIVRQGLVVALAHRPPNVYCSCSMAR